MGTIVSPQGQYDRVTAGGLDYEEQTRLTISEGAHVTITRNMNDINVGYLIQSDSDVQYKWDASSSDTISANNSITLYADTLYKITVPIVLQNKTWDLNGAEASDIYLHFKQVTSVNTKYIKYAEV